MKSNIRRGRTADLISIPLAVFATSGFVTSPAQSAPVTPYWSDYFAQMSGVATHFNHTGGVYGNRYGELRDKLVSSGLRTVRSEMASDRDIGIVRELSGLGIKTIVVIDPPSGTKPNSTYWANSPNRNIVDFLKTLGTSHVRAVEMNNELDVFYHGKYWRNVGEPLSNDVNSSLFWGKYARAATQDTWNSLRSDAATSSIPLIGPSFTSEAAYNSVGNLGSYLNYGCTHWYMAGREPETPGWGNNGYGSYSWIYNTASNVQAPGKPMISTEGGYDTAIDANTATNAIHVPEWVHGRYLPRWYMRHFLGGSTMAMSYELVDEGTSNSDPEQKYGMLRNDLSEKPAFRAVKNLIGLLQDPGPTPSVSSLDYTLGGSTANVRQLLLQKRTGEWYLVLWLDKPCWNVGNNTGISVPGQGVSVTVPSTIQSGVLHWLDDNGDMFYSNANRTANTFNITVTDRVSVLRLATNNNLAVNSSFETYHVSPRQEVFGWSTWGGSSGSHYDADFVETYGGANAGSYHGTHYKGSAYQVHTYQTLNNLPSGLYTLKVRYKSGGGQQRCYMEAKDFDSAGSAKATNNFGVFPAASSYTTATITDINVQNGKCTIGFYSNANGGNWFYFDSVEFYKQ